MHAPFLFPPGRDMANVPPFLPPDSQEMSPISRKICGSLMVAVGIGVLANVLLRLLFDMDGHAARHLLVSDFLSVLAAVSFFVCGLTVFSRGYIWSSILLVSGLLLAILAQWIG